jgi:hypothetical protein
MRPTDMARIPFRGRPAFFERASGLVFVDSTVRAWQEFCRAAAQGRHLAGTRSLLERLHHEFFHYLQFFGCGYITATCAEHYQAVRRASPFPFTADSFAEYMSRPAPRPESVARIERALLREGPSGISPLHLVEGCAQLFQLLSAEPEAPHGRILLLLAQSAAPELYGRFYHEVTLTLGERARRETLLIGSCALQFAEPERAVGEVIRIVSGLEPLEPEATFLWRPNVIAELARRFEHLGTALELSASGRVYHPLLTDQWIFADAPDWGDAIGAALAGHQRDTVARCIRHSPVVLRDGIFCPERLNSSQSKVDAVAMMYLALLSLKLGEVAAET